MSNKEELSNFIQIADKLERGTDRKLDHDDLVQLICGDCEFYNSDEDEALECSAFKLASFIFAENMIRPQDVAKKLKG